MGTAFNAQECLENVIIPGFNYFIDKFAETFLKKASLPGIGTRRTSYPEEDFKEAIGKLLDHRPQLLEAVKSAPELCLPNPCTHKTAADYLTDFAGLKEIFTALSPATADPQPIIKDRSELLVRCRKKEAFAFGGRSQPTTDRRRQMAELINLAYILVGFKSSAPPGKGALDSRHHGFEFAFLLQVLAFIETNRDRFYKAAESGAFHPAEEETLRNSARQYGFVEDAVQFLPHLGLRLIKPKKYPINDVLNFRCAVSGNSAVLDWELPRDLCDSIILERRQISSGASDWHSLIDKKSANHFADLVSTGRGEQFEYRVRSVFQKVVKETGPTLQTWIPDEITLGKPAEWRPEGIFLEWQPGRHSEGTAIFRGVDNPPKSRPEALVVSPAHDKTSYLDKLKVSPGKTYYYLVTSRYPGGVISQGVLTQVRIPLPPPPPKRVQAEYLFDSKSGQGAVRITLDLDKTSQGQYQLIRYSCSKGKVDESTATVLQKEIIGNLVKDQAVSPGKCFIYRIIPSFQGMSGTPKDSDPVPIVPGFSNLKYKRENHAISFTYKVDPAVTEVVIRRGGVQLNAFRDHARDAGLENGQKYDYNLACRYRLADGTDAWSAMEEFRGLIPRIPPIAVGMIVRVEDA